MPRIAKFLFIVLALLLALGGGTWFWFQSRSGEEVASRVTDKLESALGGRCKLGGAKVLSTRTVALSNVACTVDEGPLVGFAAVHIEVELDGPAFGSLPPLRDALVDGLHVRLRSLPLDEDDDDSADNDDSAGDESLSGILAAFAQRYVWTKDWVDGRPGGDAADRILQRLTDGGQVRVERATVELDEQPRDLPMPEEMSLRLARAGDTLEAGVAATMSSGGTVRASASATAEGLAAGQLELSSVDLLPVLQRTDAFDVRKGHLSGEVSFAAGDEAWRMTLRLEQLTVKHPFLGSEPTEMPTLGARGEIAFADEGLILRRGQWALADQEGELDVRLGPLGDQPAAYVRTGGRRLQLGRLLAALPEALLPEGWAKEIQGTMDLDLAFGGPLHDRSEWALDWEADFSRMVLADGELADQVRRLHGPFTHTFPARDDTPALRRTIGPADPHFVAWDDISSWLSAAVVSTEDAGFFSHAGFEVTELKEAMLDNLREGDGRGGSTITQQLAKNLFLSGERTLSRKLKEAVISWRLESDLPKERILEIYLNIAEWGPGIYGIQDAADHYFARTPRVLKPEEAAFLASLLPSPRRYHGYYHARGRGVTKNRQERVNQILATMSRLGSLTPRQYALARTAGVHLAPCGM